ncbi:phage tail assembly chaperone [Erythrobacter sp. HA6-11]
MSDAFAASAKRLVPIAAQILGWRPDDFWNATPDELALALTDPTTADATSTLSRTDLQHLLEREKNG